jgi:beta-glucosidase
VRRYERFVRLMVDELGHSVTTWCTINEPMVYATQGYLLGHFPPGQRNLKRAYQVAENMLRAHAKAYRAIK